MSSADIIENTSLGGASSTFDRRHDVRSPMSAGHLNASTVSMRAKATRKRKANQQHNSNFRAGYVPVDEDVLNRTGIRGRKRFFLYCVLIFLIIIALLNVAVTAWLLYILGMTHSGMSSVELTSVHGRDFMRVLADANIITLSFKDDAFLGARYNSSLSIGAPDSRVEIMVVDKAGNVSMRNVTGLMVEGGNLTVMSDDFTVNTGGTGSRPLSLDVQTLTDLGLVSNLEADNVTASKINASKNRKDGLMLESVMSDVQVSGFNGVDISSSKEDIVLRSTRTMNLESQNIISLESKSGLYLNGLTKPNHVKKDTKTVSYKVCVCKSGLLFAVPVVNSNQVSSCYDGASMCS